MIAAILALAAVLGPSSAHPFLQGVGASEGKQGVVELRASEVVEFMVKHGKVRFVAGDALQSMKIAASADALDPERAYESGVRLLKSAGLAVVAGADSPGVAEIVATPIAAKRVSRVHTSVDTLPKADEFCTLSLRLQHAVPRDVQVILINVVSFPQNCLVADTAQTLIVSDYASQLRKIAEIVKQLDVPPPYGSFRIAFTILEATKGEEAGVPEEFKTLNLPKTTGFTRFKVAGSTLVRFEFPPLRQAMKTPAPTEAVLRVAGPPPLRLELGGSVRGERGPGFERITLLLERSDAPLGVLALQTRVEFRAEDWVLVGVAPSESQTTSLVVLARAVPEK